MKTCKEIRSEFIEFFTQRGHTVVPCSSLLPAEDPTLLFANAGMNQFKDIFLARDKRDYSRAVNTQKCIRAGGKHNDLEDVGHDTYHHTFFEMLGNWSFGDYFKREAIQWAWELLAGIWRLPKERLHVTVFQGDPAEGLNGDDEADQLWRQMTDIDPSHIHRGGKKDNFWEMAQTGPCGPCSEIHIDLTDDLSGGRLINVGDSRVIELWNLVFIQYNRDECGKLTALPARHVDTGMGLERVGMVMQNKRSNYATDLFVPIIRKIETLTDHRYGAAAGLLDRFDVPGEDRLADVACRVVADHARALTFAIADGVIPSNEGRGYVLRRILRRAARYGRQYLNIEGPFIAELVPTVVELMGDSFPEIVDRRQYAAETIRSEEESFGRTLDRGIELFQRQADRLAKAGGTDLPGEVAFDLYATYGFPVDLTQLMAAERGMKVDLPGYEAAMAEHQEISRAERTQVYALGATGGRKTEFVGDKQLETDTQITATLRLEEDQDGNLVGAGKALPDGSKGIVFLSYSPFYAERGGQVGDTGYIEQDSGTFEVTDTREEVLPSGDRNYCHYGRVVKGEMQAHLGDGPRGASGKPPVQAPPPIEGRARAVVDAERRRDIMRNHTGTHLLNWALREVLGDHVSQAGSVVAPDRLRFDFTHNQALTGEQLEEAERLVNQRVLADEEVTTRTVPLAEAKKIPGVRAVFGEKYPDPVRVVLIGGQTKVHQGDEPYSAEFCGGTHLERTSQVGLFKIVSEESVAKGVRRITALTGRQAVRHVQQLDRIVRSASAALRTSPEELPDRIATLQRETKELRKQQEKDEATGAQFVADFTVDTPEGQVLIGRTEAADATAMRNLCDRLRQKGAAGAMIAAVADGKVTLVAMVADRLAETGKLKAGDWVAAAAEVVGGRGGGKPTLAQAGGKQPDKLPEALDAAAQYVRNMAR